VCAVASIVFIEFFSFVFRRRPAFLQVSAMTPAERQRAYRQRCRRGERVYRIKISDKVITALARRGMSDADTRRRQKVSDELAVILRQWAEHWLLE
jgi:hypothetical protein